MEAYSPLGSTNSPLFKNETIVKIAEKNGVEPAQVLVSWAIQRKTVVLPKSVTESRVISNLKTFTLPSEDFETLNKLSEKMVLSELVTQLSTTLMIKLITILRIRTLLKVSTYI